MTTIEKILRKKRSMGSRMTQLKTIVDGFTALNATNEVLQQNLILNEKLRTDLEQNFDEFSFNADDATYALTEKDYLDELAVLREMAIKIRTLQTGLLPVQPPPPQQVQQSTRSESRLPKLDLPMFNGNPLEWLMFRDLFMATVHNNTGYSGAEKMRCLLKYLEGDALDLVKSYALSDASYVEAWGRLNDRYQNTRILVHEILKKFCSHPCITPEDSTAMRRLVDTAHESIRSLKILNIATNGWDPILVYLMGEKLDGETKHHWELSLSTNDVPKFDDLLNFLEKRSRALASKLTNMPPKSSTSQPTKKPSSSAKSATVHHGNPSKCSFCKQGHYINNCETFLGLSVNGRANKCKEKGLCFNCLKYGHSASSCQCVTNCKTCGKRHHTLLHYTSSAEPSSRDGASGGAVSAHTISENKEVLLGTAVIMIKDATGSFQQCRALLDSGSTTTFISNSCATRLGLHRRRSNLSIRGLSQSSVGITRGVTDITVNSCHDKQFSCKLTAYIMNSVTRDLPSTSFQRGNWPHLESIKLADPDFHISRAVDLLIGVDGLQHILLGGVIRGNPGEPLIQQTRFGWVTTGPVSVSRNIIVSHHVTLDDLVHRLWATENISSSNLNTPEEEACEKHFQQHHSRDDTGRYTVRLPIKTDVSSLGSSRAMAIQRLRAQERKLAMSESLRQQYNDFMREYINLGHMRLLSPSQVNVNLPNTYYMPHHSVVKESSTTTKLRVVFDASAKTTTGVSLNNIMMVGPKTQPDLYQILVRFRFHRIALVGDIEKMYRQIRVHPDDTHMQRIVWRDSPQSPIQDYELLTVTYGTASAPYLATRCLNQLALDYKEEYPAASKVVLRDFYVDDMVTGASTVEDAIALQQSISALMNKAHLNLRKWMSNDANVLLAVSSCATPSSEPITWGDTDTVMTLGIRWQPVSDMFSFSVTSPRPDPLPTKRKVLSEVAKLYDPLGWLAPIIVKAKVFIQSMWKIQLKWDDELPAELLEEWKSYQEQLPTIRQISIPRCVITPEAKSLEVHAFCDASEKAYAAVLYLKCTSVSGITTQLITAKTRVAPIKQLSIPRLELNAAVLLSHLVRLFQETVELDNVDYFAWSDSTIVLSWLASSPSRWNTYVGNRVAEIQRSIPMVKWHHVRTHDNPADAASRGTFPSELAAHNLWWTGPQWLCSPHFRPGEFRPDDTHEEERKVVFAHHVYTEPELLTRFSSWSTLLRVTAYMLRFCNNSRVGSLRSVGPLSVHELNHAKNLWIRQHQAQQFADEIKALGENHAISQRSRIIKLTPFLDKEGLLRVGGRLHHGPFSTDKKHPLLLAGHGTLPKLIVSSQHKLLLHGGPQLMVASLQQWCWILRCRDLCRKVYGECVICVRHKGQTQTQLMGSLPLARVTPGRPFQRCGVDFAGPYSMRVLKGRGNKHFKAYVVLFICFTTRAVHLDITSDLSTEAFMASFKRFVSRRGRPTEVYSDCGSNFIGGLNEMKAFMQFIRSQHHNDVVSKALAQDGITWKLNPPSAPHFGGLWEAGIKSMKYHLKRVIGKNNFNFEEMLTLLAQIEACLNSRPLTQISSDPADLTALTPGHFLIGAPLTSIPEPDLTDQPPNRLNRWQLIQTVAQHFWKRWSREFLSRLQQRPKWLNGEINLKVGDLVLIKDDRMPPLKWKLGRVCIIHPGSDGKVRVVTMKTQDGDVVRPIQKVSLLPINDNDHP